MKNVCVKRCLGRVGVVACVVCVCARGSFGDDDLRSVGGM